MIKYLLIIPVIIVLNGCERTQVVESDPNTQEFVVVRAELNSASAFSGVTFTKTLPIGITYDIKAAELKDVKAYLKINGVQVIPLHYVRDGLYMPLYEIIIQAGYSYELFAEWEGTIIYSSTRVPFIPEINSVYFINQGNYLQANIKSHPGEVYGAIWVIGSGYVKATAFPSLISTDSSSVYTSVITNNLPVQYSGNDYNGLRNIQVFSYDKQYEAYFNSAKLNVPDNNGFLHSGGTVGWNVYGNNVIGIFIGVGEGAIKNVN